MKAVVVVDTSINHYEDLLSGLPPGADVLLLNAASSGASQIASYLQGRSDINALHIYSHGSAGALALGNGVANAEALASESDTWAAIGQSLTADADILLYGCNVAQGEVGQAFIEKLAGVTGADVAASVDLTGVAALGGDWVFEANVGLVRTRDVGFDHAFFGLLQLQNDYIRELVRNFVCEAYHVTKEHVCRARHGRLQPHRRCQPYPKNSLTSLSMAP